MRSAKIWAALVLALTLTVPVFASPTAGGPKSWLHSHHRKSGSPHPEGNHAVTKHKAPKHAKPHH